MVDICCYDLLRIVRLQCLRSCVSLSAVVAKVHGPDRAGKQWQTNGNQQSSSMTPWPNAILDTVCDSPPNPVCCWNSTPSFGLFNPSDCCRAVCAMGCNGSPGHPCWALPLQQVSRSNSQHRSTSINIQQVCSTSHLPI